MRYKRITAHRALDMLRILERVRHATSNAEQAAARCAIDNVADALDAHVRQSLAPRRKR